MSWGKIIDSSEQVTVVVNADRGVARTGGTFINCLRTGKDEYGRDIYQPGPLTKVLTGTSCFSYEMIININSKFKLCTRILLVRS